MFTSRCALSPYIKQTRLDFKCLMFTQSKNKEARDDEVVSKSSIIAASACLPEARRNYQHRHTHVSVEHPATSVRHSDRQCSVGPTDE